MERSARREETEEVRVTRQEQQEKEPHRTQTAGTSHLFISLYLAAVAAHADDSLAFLSHQRAAHVTEWEPQWDEITPETQTLTGPGAAQGEDRRSLRPEKSRLKTTSAAPSQQKPQCYTLNVKRRQRFSYRKETVRTNLLN